MKRSTLFVIVGIVVVLVVFSILATFVVSGEGSVDSGAALSMIVASRR